MATGVLINICLNFFWSWLIIRQGYRIIMAGGADEDMAGDEGKTKIDPKVSESDSKKKNWRHPD